jgi:glucose/arabinose dehydrogenase
MTDEYAKEKKMALLSLRAVVLSLCGWILVAVAAHAQSVEFVLTTVAKNLDRPWSVVELPDNSFLVTQLGGELLRVVQDGTTTEIGGVPPTYVAGQGGFFDVVLHPEFASNQLIYLSYAHGTPEANGTAITRARLEGERLADARQILLVEPLKDTPQHYGGRMLFLDDGTLLLTTGDGFDYREQAQDLDSELGKVLRINDDGTVPGDNPFGDGPAQRVWTYGHRNPQGLVLSPGGAVLLHEHGPRGGDEINVLEAGKNYGWPAITHGVNYSGARVSPYTEAEGMEQPLVHWVPSIAPSGMAWYEGDAFPQWRGDLFIGALVDREVRRIDLEQGEVVKQEALFSDLGERIRDVRTGRDGYLYLLTDGNGGKLIQVSPKLP